MNARELQDQFAQAALQAIITEPLTPEDEWTPNVLRRQLGCDRNFETRADFIAWASYALASAMMLERENWHV